jgi:hypothetical protein
MNDLRTRAVLVDFDHAGSIGTVVPRAEIAEAAGGTEFPATLLLDLDLVEAEDAGDVTAHASVAIEWDQNTLEQLLASTDSDEIELRFDQRELALAFDKGDVEAHGIREKTAILAVAVAAAGVSASPALARMAADTGGTGAVASSTASVNPQTGVQRVPVGGAERALVQEEKLTAGMSTSSGTVDTSSAGESNAAVGDKGAVIASRGGAERALQQDEKFAVTLHPGSGTVAASSDDGSLSGGELAGVLGGGVLLIAAAGFGVARKHTPPAEHA